MKIKFLKLLCTKKTLVYPYIYNLVKFNLSSIYLCHDHGFVFVILPLSRRGKQIMPGCDPAAPSLQSELIWQLLPWLQSSDVDVMQSTSTGGRNTHAHTHTCIFLQFHFLYKEHIFDVLSSSSKHLYFCLFCLTMWSPPPFSEFRDLAGVIVQGSDPHAP